MPTSPLPEVATIPIFIWELSVGACMAVRGFRPSPITGGSASASALPVRSETVA